MTDAKENVGRLLSRRPASRRPRHRMPPDVEKALLGRGLMAAYRSRPPYQQNDYLGWIAMGQRQDTRDKRIAQMLDELESADRYMKMDYRNKEGTP